VNRRGHVVGVKLKQSSREWKIKRGEASGLNGSSVFREEILNGNREGSLTKNVWWEVRRIERQEKGGVRGEKNGKMMHHC